MSSRASVSFPSEDWKVQTVLVFGSTKTQGHRRAVGAREAAQAGQASPPWRVRLSSNVG